MEKRRVADLIKQFESNQSTVCRVNWKVINELWDKETESSAASASPVQVYIKNYSSQDEAEECQHQPENVTKNDEKQSRNGYVFETINKFNKEFTNNKIMSVDIEDNLLSYDYVSDDENFFSATSLRNGVDDLDDCSIKSESIDIPPLTLYESLSDESEYYTNINKTDDNFDSGSFISAQSATSIMSDNNNCVPHRKTDENFDYFDGLCRLFCEETDFPEINKLCTNSCEFLNETSWFLSEEDILFKKIYDLYTIDGDMDLKFIQLFRDTFRNEEDEFNMCAQLYESLLS